MRGYGLLKTVCRIILPFMILYGLYIIINGDISPGGGFQGGVVLATCYIAVFFIKDEQVLSFKEIIRIEKLLFGIFVFLGVLHMLTFRSAIEWFPIEGLKIHISTLTLMLFNLLIGLKVAIGFWGIMLIFTEEGQL